MSVHPFRSAILIFFIGASVANVLATKLEHDRLHYSTAVAPTPSAAASNPWLVPDPNTNLDAIKLHGLANDKAWMREAIIVTTAGAAWFLVRPQATS
jgi:hypothetical protein